MWCPEYWKWSSHVEFLIAHQIIHNDGGLWLHGRTFELLTEVWSLILLEIVVECLERQFVFCCFFTDFRRLTVSLMKIIALKFLCHLQYFLVLAHQINRLTTEMRCSSSSKIFRFARRIKFMRCGYFFLFLILAPWTPMRLFAYTDCSTECRLLL